MVRALRLAGMLKITIDDSAGELRFRLEGKLSGPWVNELRQCWVTASSTTIGRTSVLDLREVDFIDREGQSLLAEMARAGVRMAASTPLIQAIVDEVAGRTQYASVGETPAPSPRLHRPHALFRSHTSGRNPGAL